MYWQSPTEAIDATTPRLRQHPPKAEGGLTLLVGVVDDRARMTLRHGDVQYVENKFVHTHPAIDEPTVRSLNVLRAIAKSRHLGKRCDSGHTGVEREAGGDDIPPP